MIDPLEIDTAATMHTPEQTALRIIAKYAGHIPTHDEELTEIIPNALDRELSLRAALEERFCDVSDVEFRRWLVAGDVVRWADGVEHG